MFKQYEEFVNEDLNMEITGGFNLSPVVDPTTFSFNRPMFTVKLLGQESSKADWQGKTERSSNVDDYVPKKGDRVEVYDLKNKKTYQGTFLVGYKNDKDFLYKIKLLDDNKKVITIYPEKKLKK